MKYQPNGNPAGFYNASAQSRGIVIYALIHPITKEVRYIGYTSKPLQIRLNYHYYDIKKGVTSHKVSWLKSLTKQGLKAEIISIDFANDIEAARLKEVYWISIYPNLTNSTTGGETSKTYLKDVKDKMSTNRKGKAVGINNPMFGKKRNDLFERNINNNPGKESIVRRAEDLRIKYSTAKYKKIHIDSQKTKKGVLQLTKLGEIIRFYPSLRNAGLHGFGRKEIMLCINGVYKQHKGYLWKAAA